MSRFGGGVVPKGVSTPDEAPESALMPGTAVPFPLWWGACCHEHPSRWRRSR